MSTDCCTARAARVELRAGATADPRDATAADPHLQHHRSIRTLATSSASRTQPQLPETWPPSGASADRTHPIRAALRAGLAALAFVLLPKCPACLAVYLGALGVGAGIATPVAAGLRGAALAALIALSTAAAVTAARRALRHAR